MKFNRVSWFLSMLALIVAFHGHVFGQRAAEDSVVTWNNVAMEAARNHNARGCLGRNPLADFLYWRIPEQPVVLPAELRGAFISDPTAYSPDIFSLVSQDASCLLETKLLLILQRAHARYLAKPLVKTGGAHACLPCEAIDAKRLAKMLPEPHDGGGNPL